MGCTLFCFYGVHGSKIDSGIRLSPQMIYRSVMKLTQWASCGLVSFSYVVEQPFASSDMERICMYFGYFAVNASFNVVVMVHCFLSLLSLSFFSSSGKLMSLFLRKHYYYCGDNDNNCADNSWAPFCLVCGKDEKYDYPK